MGGPVKFINANGPMPIRNAFFATLSIAAALAIPSSSSKQASFNQGTKNRFTTNPGRSLQTITTLPMVLQYCSTATRDSGDVVSAGIISISRFFAG